MLRLLVMLHGRRVHDNVAAENVFSPAWPGV